MKVQDLDLTFALNFLSPRGSETRTLQRFSESLGIHPFSTFPFEILVPVKVSPKLPRGGLVGIELGGEVVWSCQQPDVTKEKGNKS